MKTSMLTKISAVLLAMLLLLSVTAMAEEEAEEADLPENIAFTEDNALDEEDTRTVALPEVGEYEWYMLPAEQLEGHAYVDMYPDQEQVKAVKGQCTFTFTLEEVGGHSFTINAATVIGFIEDEEVMRETMTDDEVDTWCPGGVLDADATANYTATLTREGMTAIALSVIGNDDADEELEFHSIVYIED